MDLWCSLECTLACQAGGRGFKSRQVRQAVAFAAGFSPGWHASGTMVVPALAGLVG